MAIVQGFGKENRVIAIQGAHRFLGELSLIARNFAIPVPGGG